MIPHRAPSWLLDLWRYESSHEDHSVFIDSKFTQFLYETKGFRIRQEIKP